MRVNPFLPKRVKEKRKDPRRVRGRVILDAAGKRELRLRRYEHAQEKCETCLKPVPLDGPLEVRAHLSHLRHGPHKSDTFDQVIIECYDCHIVEGHSGGKPVSKKPGRRMSKSEAMRYLRLTRCMCVQAKKAQSPFCDECLKRLSPQSLMDLEKLTGREWLGAMANCEKELMAG